jgi:hypothetical protein
MTDSPDSLIRVLVELAAQRACKHYLNVANGVVYKLGKSFTVQ